MTARDVRIFVTGHLAVLALALGILVGVPAGERRTPRSDDVAEPWAPPLAPIQRVRVDRSEGEDVTLEREGEGWSLAAPFAAVADPVVAGALLDELALGAGVPVATAPAELGLEPPSVVVEIETVSGLRVLEVGRLAPVGQRSYVRVDRGRVFAVSHPLPGLRSAAPDELRDQRLITLRPGEVQRVTVDGGDGPAFTLRRGDPVWTVDAGGAAATVDPVRLEDWFAALYATRAATGASTPPFGDLSRRVRVASAATTQTLEISQSESGLAAVRVDGGRLVAVETGRLSFLFADPSALARPGDGHDHGAEP